MTLFCFGLGYSARVFAAELLKEGWRVRGTTRDPEKAQVLRQQGIDATTLSADSELPPPALANVTHVLSSVPPDDAGDPIQRRQMRSLEAAPNLRWAGYLSTTGVYGDRQGGWVDETSACRPTTPRGRRRVDAEQAWLDFGRRTGVPVHVFRLAGIYGPGRNALATVRSGRARRIVKPGQVFSRIHVADIAQVLRASVNLPQGGAAYNLCDDEAAPPQDVIAYACKLLNRPVPPDVPFDEAELSEMARSFYAENKRVRNDLIKRELAVTLLYPTYRDGLKALLASESS